MGPSASGGQDHYFTGQPASENRPRTVRLTLPDLTADLASDAGVFSADAVDSGTKYLLLEDARPPDHAVNLLDLGCGYGPIAVTLARRSPQATVWAVDVNTRALELTAHNATATGADGVRTALPEDVPADVRFDAIYSNPPIRIGKLALHELLTRWLDRLTAEGTATLVVQKNLGSDSLQRWLTENGWLTERLGSRSGYRLLKVSAR